MKKSILLMSAAALILSGLPASADKYYKGVNEKMPVDTDLPVPQAGQVTTVGTQTYTTLATPPDMPFIPQYTGAGKRFSGGKKIANNQSGESGLEANFLCKEDQRSVLEWYKQVLKQMQWGCEADSGNTSVSGNKAKEGYKVTVQTHQAPDDSGFQTLLVVHFYAHKPVVEEPDQGEAQDNKNQMQRGLQQLLQRPQTQPQQQQQQRR